MDDGRAAEDHTFAQHMAGIGEEHKGDAEATQSEAEKYLCEILTRLGYAKLIAVFQELDKY